MILLAADIGGTHTRIQVCEADRLIVRMRYKNKDYSDLITIFNVFFVQNNINKASINSACFGIAGPITNNLIKITNLPWVINVSEIRNYLGVDKFEIINDFTAIGYGLESLQPKDLLTIQSGKINKLGSKAFIGAGTGLGVGFIAYYDNNKYIINPSEGGHVDFAPTTEQQIDLLRYLSKKYHHVSLERVLSGGGLVNIYNFLTNDAPNNHIDAASISALAMQSSSGVQKQDLIAKQALEIFWQIYGAAAGNLALTALPYSGLYVVGGIAAKLAQQIQTSGFLQAFQNKGRMSELVTDIPLHIVLCEYVGLQGANICARNL